MIQRLNTRFDNYSRGHEQRGNFEEALDLIIEALEQAKRNGEHWWDSELRRLQGIVTRALSSQDGTKAETCFQQAISIARTQGAKSFELLAATDLARLYESQGNDTEAKDLLAPIYEWFTEGFDTPNLRTAKTLLEQLT